MKLSSNEIQLYNILHLSIVGINLVKSYRQFISNAVFIKNETNILKHRIHIYILKKKFKKKRRKTMKIAEIEGVGEKYAKKLEKAAIANVEDLIPLKWSEIKELAKTTSISLKLLEKWQDQTELMVIKGIGPEYSEVLNKIGIDSTRELAYRNPKNTLDKIIEFDKKQPDVIRKIPKVEDIEGWIDKAKEMFK